MRHLEPIGAERTRRLWRYRGLEDDGGDPRRPPLEHVHTLILSDLHLGSPVTRAGAVIATLNTFSFEQIILNGDVFDSLDFSRLPKQHWKVLSRIRKLTSPDRPLIEAWVRGNHDLGIIDVMSHLVGIPVFNEYRWEHRGNRYLAMHGDQFDSVIGRSPVATRWLGLLHQPLRALDPENRHVVAWMLKRVAAWRRESARVMEGAVRQARRRSVQTVICGHTHEATDATIDGIRYLNGGSWTQDPCSFVTVGDEGPVLHEVRPSAHAT
jgi:UDP-2,3-diacylglucosamine pyrophosphatase LpxH